MRSGAHRPRVLATVSVPASNMSRLQYIKVSTLESFFLWVKEIDDQIIFGITVQYGRLIGADTYTQTGHTDTHFKLITY